MLVTLIQRFDKKSFHFKNERLKFYRLSSATFNIYCIDTIYQFIKPFLDNKMSIFEEYGPLTVNTLWANSSVHRFRIIFLFFFAENRF